jgi:hypothetical protein
MACLLMRIKEVTGFYLRVLDLGLSYPTSSKAPAPSVNALTGSLLCTQATHRSVTARHDNHTNSYQRGNLIRARWDRAAPWQHAAVAKLVNGSQAQHPLLR